MGYQVREVEKKWQARWAQEPFTTKPPTDRQKKYYCLDMFPYPSGSGPPRWPLARVCSFRRIYKNKVA